MQNLTFANDTVFCSNCDSKTVLFVLIEVTIYAMQLCNYSLQFSLLQMVNIATLFTQFLFPTVLKEQGF